MNGFARVTLRRLGAALALLLVVLTLGLAALPAMALVNAGGLDTPDVAIDIELVDGVAYIADYATASTNQGSSLRIVDVSDPQHPVELGSSASPVAPRGLRVAGGLVFVADSEAGLRILDASDPAAPSELSLLALPGVAYGVELAGDLAYLSTGPATGGTEGGLHVVDVSDPAQPTLLGSLTLPGENARDADAAGGLVYVVASSTTQLAGNLYVVDVSDPTQPTAIATLALPNRASDVAVSEGLAYVANGVAGLTIVDVTSPAAPAIRGGIDTFSVSRGVSVAGGLVHLMEVGLGSQNTSVLHAALRLIDASDPANPIEIGGLAMPETLAPDFLDGAFQAEIERGHAYVANGRAGLRIVDLANPSYPEYAAWIGAAHSRGIEFSGSRAYVADVLYGVHVFEAADPSAPQYVSTFLADGSASQDVVAQDQLAYVSSVLSTTSGQLLWSGIRIVNVANAASATEVGSIALEGSPGEIALSGDLLLVVESQGTLRLIDVANPQAPSAVGGIAIPGAATVEVDGTTAFVAAGSNGLRIVDVSQPGSPVEIAAVAGQIGRVAIDAARDLALVADSADPAAPRLRVIDFSDPAHPSEISSWQAPGISVAEIALSGGFAYVAGSGVVSVVDLMDPTAPRELGRPLVSESFWANYAWTNVAVKDGVIWAATQSQGLYVIELGPDYASLGDFDEDGARGREDNCSEAPNASQLDVNQDGFGNACDADYNDDGVVGGPDWAAFGRSFGSVSGSTGYDAVLDANGDGVIGGPDWALLGRSFGKPPGPSGLACAGSAPCPAP